MKKLVAVPENSYPLGDIHKMDLETSNIKYLEYPPKVKTIRDVFRGHIDIEYKQITTK